MASAEVVLRWVGARREPTSVLLHEVSPAAAIGEHEVWVRVGSAWSRPAARALVQQMTGGHVVWLDDCSGALDGAVLRLEEAG